VTIHLVSNRARTWEFICSMLLIKASNPTMSGLLTSLDTMSQGMRSDLLTSLVTTSQGSLMDRI
jgi:hypothetical protein